MRRRRRGIRSPSARPAAAATAVPIAGVSTPARPFSGSSTSAIATVDMTSVTVAYQSAPLRRPAARARA